MSKKTTRTKVEIRELYYITHVKNIPSILQKGILSHDLILKNGIEYEKIYNEDIVSMREGIIVPNIGKSLWSFANLYFQARNPMLYNVVRNKSLSEIAVIGVDKSLLNRPDVILTTGNAAHSKSDFVPASQKAKILPAIIEAMSKEYWKEADGSKREIMAECLVPDIVPPEYIRSIYFADYSTKYRVQESVGSLSRISFMYMPWMFFQPTRSRRIAAFLSVLEGDMFFLMAQTLTISVNTVGIMGKGVASRAKNQFCDVYVYYQDLCRNHQLKMGKPVLYKRETSFDFELADSPLTLKEPNVETWFLLFPTKKNWKDKADIQGIEKGLQWIVENYRKECIKSLALPALGCGLGGLEWSEVGPLLCRYLSALNIPVYIYLPAEKIVPDEQLSPEFLLPKLTA